MRIITSNTNKLREMRSSIPDLEQLDIDLPEVQSLDPYEIIRAKLEAAREASSEDLIVEDTSLSLDCLRGLPGPFIKFFMERLGTGGLADLALRYDERGAIARTIIGYASGDRIEFFEGSVRGTIVEPRGGPSFGWDPIFEPEGYSETYAELGEEKKRMSHRTKAVEKLVKHLEEQRKQDLKNAASRTNT